MNEILNEAYVKHSPNLVCWNNECKAKASLKRCGFSRSGFQNVKCNQCNKTTSQIADVVYNSVGVKLEFEGKEMTSTPSLQHAINAAIRNPTNAPSTDKEANESNSALIAELLQSNKDLSDANNAMATQMAKLNTQLAEQSETIKTLSASIAALTQTVSSETPGQAPPLINNPAPVEDTAAPAAPEGSVARREIPQGSAGNADNSNQENPNPKPAKASWADIAKTKRPAIETLSEKEQTRFKETTKNLAALGFKPVPIQRRRPAPTGTGPAAAANKESEKPKPVPVYFGGVPRGPIGKLRAELRNCLPKWSILHLSFIGNSATEILCHEPLVDKLVGGMKLLGFRHMPNYNPLKEKNTDDATLRGKVNCYNRWRWGAESSYSEVSRQWFKEQMEQLAKESPNVKEGADEKHNSNAAKKSAEDGEQKEPEKEPEAPAPAAPEQPAETTEAQQRPEGEDRQ